MLAIGRQRDRNRAARAPAAGLLALVLAAATAGVAAREFTGRVVRVVDGDTVEVAVSEDFEARVRLAGIDAPEADQPFGTASRDNLEAFVGGRTVTVEWRKRDGRGRILGIVHRDGDDANLWQLYRGYAWHYRAYAGEQDFYDRAVYAAAEADARQARRGLWAAPRPVAPWKWRERKRRKR